MHIDYSPDYETMSQRAANFLIPEITGRPKQWWCTATGQSPKRVYELLGSAATTQSGTFAQLEILKLDEWGGLPMESPTSCETYLQERLLRPLGIAPEAYHGFDGNSDNADAESERLQKVLLKKGSIDLCILGLGKNGHLGFNEPAEFLYPFCHVARLTLESQSHHMVEDLDRRPSYGLTLGMGDILRSKKILLLVTGPGKEAVFHSLMQAKVDPRLPASFLWLHPEVHCFVDVESVPTL